MIDIIKPHIGYFVICLVCMYFPYIVKDELSDTYRWFIPTLSALILLVIAEVIGWVLFWCFS